jgi:hypothetical protein
MYFSLADGSIGMKENDCNWPCSKMPYLQETGGYTTFSQNIPDYEQKLAFAHVHGKDPASTDVGNTWSRGPSRIHYGNTDRDFNAFVRFSPFLLNRCNICLISHFCSRK